LEVAAIIVKRAISNNKSMRQRISPI